MHAAMHMVRTRALEYLAWDLDRESVWLAWECIADTNTTTANMADQPKYSDN